MNNRQLKCHWPGFDLSMTSKVKFYQVNRKAIYDLLYVFYTNFHHTMYRFWDISWNRSQRSKLDLSDLENDLYNQSTPLKFENSTRITSEKPYEAIHLGSTSILRINIQKYVKMSQTGPFCPWQGPLEWFNQILFFTFHHHHPGEASCQTREKVTEQILNKWTISVKIGEVSNLDLSDLEKWPLERFNQIQLWVVD